MVGIFENHIAVFNKPVLDDPAHHRLEQRVIAVFLFFNLDQPLFLLKVLFLELRQFTDILVISAQFDFAAFATVHLAAATDMNIAPFRVMPEILDFRKLPCFQHLRHTRFDVIHRLRIDTRKPVRITFFSRRMIVKTEQLEHHVAGIHPSDTGSCIHTNRPEPGIAGIQDLLNPVRIAEQLVFRYGFHNKCPSSFSTLIVMRETLFLIMMHTGKHFKRSGK